MRNGGHGKILIKWEMEIETIEVSLIDLERWLDLRLSCCWEEEGTERGGREERKQN